MPEERTLGYIFGNTGDYPKRKEWPTSMLLMGHFQWNYDDVRWFLTSFFRISRAKLIAMFWFINYNVYKLHAFGVLYVNITNLYCVYSVAGTDFLLGVATIFEIVIWCCLDFWKMH